MTTKANWWVGYAWWGVLTAFVAVGGFLQSRQRNPPHPLDDARPVKINYGKNMRLEVCMRSTVVSLVIAAAMLVPHVCTAADINDIAGTWSGNWTPKGGVLEAVTIEFRVESGKVSGKFRTPVAMDFTKATFNASTGVVAIEATDTKANKLYKIDGKVTGNDLKGTLVVGGTPGDVLLIKWTYIPR